MTTELYSRTSYTPDRTYMMALPTKCFSISRTTTRQPVLNYDPSHLLLQQLDYLEFIRLYGERVKGFHVKDAEFRPTGRVGVYGGYQSWAGRAGRFRSLGDGQVDFRRVFTLLSEAGYEGWATLEWECCVKSPAQGAAEAHPLFPITSLKLPK